jgi:pantothenate kinase type III
LQLFQKTVTNIDYFDADLTLRGLQKIFERNRQKIK